MNVKEKIPTETRSTEQKQEEEKLRQYERIVSTSSDMLALLDKKFKYLAANKAYIGAFNKAPDEIIGHTVKEVFGEEFFTSVIKPNADRCLGGEEINYQAWVDFPALGKRYMDATYSPYYSADNEITGFVVSSRDITERKRIEDRLRVSEENLLESNRLMVGILEHTHMMAVFLDPQFNFVWVNNAYADAGGHKPSFFLGKNHFNLYPHEENQAIFQGVVDSGESFFVEAKPFEFPDQPERGVTYWDWSLIPIKDDVEKVTGLVFTLADVTKRIRAEVDFENLFNLSPDMVAVFTTEGKLLKTNPSWEKILGYTQQELLELGWAELVHPDDVEKTNKVVEKQLSGSSIDNFINRYKHKDDSYRTLEWQATFATDGIVHATARDITERKKAEDALRAERDKLKQIFESMIDGVYIVSQDYDIEYVNPVLIADFGPYENRKCYTYFHDREEVCPWCKNKEVLAGETVRWEWYSSKNDRTYDLIDTPLYNTDGSISKFEIFRDITDQKKLEKQLHQSQKMDAIGRLAGGIAHDFNNALTVISGNTELILIDLPEESPHRDRIVNIRKAVTHATGLTQQLLAFSRKQIAEPRILDINDTISDLIGMLHRVIGEDIKLTFLPDEDVGNIYMDPEQLTQVLMNLVVNAREAMSRGGTLAIETEQVEIDKQYVNTHPYMSPGLYAQLTVSDTGVGMSDKIRDQVFEPFFTTKESGTGLGMSTVFGIVKQNGGAINVYSEEGIGTTFKIYLPITLERADADPAETSEADLTTGSEIILLVEDEDTVRDLATEILTNLGYKVHNFAGAKEALLFAENHKETIDLLLTDVVMPGMDGSELANAIQESYPSVRVLYMSGYTDNTIAHHGMLHEGVDLLQKPFSLAGIAKKIREILDAPNRSD